MFAMASLAVVPVLGVAIVHGLDDANSFQQEKEAILRAQARGMAESVDRDLTMLRLVLQTLASGAGQDDFARRTRDVADALRSSIEVRGAEAPGSGAQPRLNLSADPTGHTIRLSVPLVDAAQAPAMLDLTIPAERLAPMLSGASQDPPATVLLLDPAGRVAAATGEARMLLGQIVAHQNGADGLSTARWADGPEQIYASAPLAQAEGWGVIIGQDCTALRARENEQVRWHLVMAAAGIAVSLLLVMLLSRRLSRPLRSLTEHASTVALAEQSTAAPPGGRLQASSIAEFEALRLGMIRADAVLRRRVAAERIALREARTGHELLDSVVNATAESIYVKDLELRYVLVNRAALRSGPNPREEWQVLGRAAGDLYPPMVARRIERADRDVLATGRMTSFEQDIDWPEQPTRWLWFTITPWKDAEDRVVGVVSVSRDITEQRAAGIRLRGMQADLLRATRLSAMGAMASGLAHELNQPLAAATNYLNASVRLMDRAGSVPEELRMVRGAVTDAVQQLLRSGAIVRRLRDFVGRGEAELQPEDVSDLIRGVVELARADGITRGIDLRMVLAPHTATVLIDITQMQQVLLNLIRNAAEAITSAREAAPDRERGVIVVAALVRPPEGTCIDVIDNGPGLAEGMADRLFQPFMSTKPTGMGIGLTICHTIVQGHGGDLLATPASGGGMRFRIQLPPAPQPGQPG